MLLNIKKATHPKQLLKKSMKLVLISTNRNHISQSESQNIVFTF